MKQYAKRLGGYLPLMLILTAVATVMRCIACYNELDISTGHFNNDLTNDIATYLTVGAIVLYLTRFVSYKGERELRASFSNPITYLPAGAVSVALCFFATDRITSAAGYRSDVFPERIELLWSLALSILAILSVGYFFLNCLTATAKSRNRAWLGMAASLFFAVYPMYLHFDARLAINAPTKLVDEMAYLFTALFFLYETRISLGRDKWRSYVTFGLIAAHLTAFSSIPSLMLYFTKGYTVSASLYESVLTLTLFFFILARLILCELLKPNKRSPVAELIDERDSERRAAEKAKQLTANETEEITDDEALARDNNIMVENPVTEPAEGENYAMDLDGEEAQNKEYR